MATQPLSPPGLKLQLEEKPNEIVVHCKGRITAENSEVFQREIRDLIPKSGGQAGAITYRIVLDLSNVTHVDSAGLGALLGAWTAAQRKGCDLELANLNPPVEKVVEMTKLHTVFKRARVVAAGASRAAMPVAEDAKNCCPCRDTPSSVVSRIPRQGAVYCSASAFPQMP